MSIEMNSKKKLRRATNNMSKSNEKATVMGRSQIYPMSAERELARVTLYYTDAYNYAFKSHLKDIKALYEMYERADSRFDDVSGFRDKLSSIFSKVGASYDKKTGKTDAKKTIERAGKIGRKASIDDWVDIVKDKLGVQVYKKYYEETTEDRLQRWVAQNVSYVQSIPYEQHKALEDIILWGYQTHQPMVNVYRRLEKQLGVSRKQAKFLARDQMGSLNGQMIKYEQESMGVQEYRWKTKRDKHVRDCHRELEGTIHGWDDPPEMWYMTKRGRVYTGRKCHPGEDYLCRCTATPIFRPAVVADKMAHMHYKA